VRGRRTKQIHALLQLALAQKPGAKRAGHSAWRQTPRQKAAPSVQGAALQRRKRSTRTWHTLEGAPLLRGWTEASASAEEADKGPQLVSPVSRKCTAQEDAERTGTVVKPPSRGVSVKVRTDCVSALAGGGRLRREPDSELPPAAAVARAARRLTQRAPTAHGSEVGTTRLASDILRVDKAQLRPETTTARSPLIKQSATCVHSFHNADTPLTAVTQRVSHKRVPRKEQTTQRL
jgi:hypothetical protein